MNIHTFASSIALPRKPAQQAGNKRKRNADNADQTEATSREHEDVEGAESHSAEDGYEEDLPRDYPLAPLKPPPIDIPIDPPQHTQRNLKLQHFHVLNAIFHRSLLDRDYARAGKAFALLLRYEIGGVRIDLRKFGLWGVGAEILLQNTSSRRGFGDDEDEDEGFEGHEVMGHEQQIPQFSVAALGAAKAYYERLIVQFPFQKNRPHDVGSWDFYPAMFGVWILQVVQASKRRRRRLRDHVISVNEREALDEGGPGLDEVEIKTEELAQAREVAASLNGILTSPPFDRHAALLKLQAHVCLWIADLIGTVAQSQGSERESRDLREDAKRALKKARDHGASLMEAEVELLEEEDGGEVSP